MARTNDVDLGSGHILHWVRWAPDDLPENRAHYGYPLPVVEKAGALIYHLRPDGADVCRGYVNFDIPETRPYLEGGRWSVESWEPLTVAPSIHCTVCGDHGYIRNGRWVKD